MTAEIDIWRAARLLVDKHGADAPVRAAMRVDELQAQGDVEGGRTWKRIITAAEELLRPIPMGTVH